MSLPACITLRTVKGSVLSWGELDNNFVCLNNSINSLASVIGNGNRWHIPSGTTLTIETDYQHFIYGDMLIEGVLQLSGGSQLVVLNGNINLSGGTIVGPGTIYNITLSGNSVTAANLYWTSGSTGNYSIKADNNSGLDATGDYSTAIGYNTLSSGLYSFSQGYNTQSNGIASYAGGNNTIASGDFQHVVGKFNLPVLSDSSFIIGNGTNSFSPSNLVLATGNDFIVYGRTVTDDFRMTSGATNGYILTSDAIGNASWQSLPVITGNSVTGLTFNNSNFDLTIGTTSGDFTQSLSILATDMTVTGGTYNPSTGIATFTTNSGNTFNISGFLTGYTDISVSAITYDSITGTLNLLQTDSSILTATGFTNNDFYVTGGTLVGGTLTLERQDGVVTIPGFASSFTGNTSGDCITDLFVSNVNSCSPLRIQPTSVGDVYIGENGGVNVGIGTSSPTSRLEVKGVDSTSSNYSLKVENSGSTSLLSVRNDGIINFGNAVETNQRLVRFGQDTSFVDIGSRAVTSTFAAIYFNAATPSVNNYALIGNGTDLFLGGGTSGTIGFKFNSSTNTFALTKHTCTFTPFGLGNADGLVFNMSGSSRSYLTAGADHTWGNIDMSTATHPEGSTALQRDFVVRGRQHTFAGVSTTYTIAEAGTFVIDGAPQASVRCDITNNSALLIQSQNVVNGVFGTVTNSYGLTVNSQTGATNNYAAIFLGGNVGIGTSTPTSQLDINGTNGYNQLRLRTSYTPSGSTDINGSIGDVSWDDNYFYWKTSTQWLRISGQTW